MGSDRASREAVTCGDGKREGSHPLAAEAPAWVPVWPSGFQLKRLGRYGNLLDGRKIDVPSLRVTGAAGTPKLIAEDKESGICHEKRATKAHSGEAICHIQPSACAKPGKKPQGFLPSTSQCSKSKFAPFLKHDPILVSSNAGDDS